jgi:hypothetical protein
MRADANATAGPDTVSAERPRYTIATLVNNTIHYEDMLASFAEGGFTAPACEFIRIDNTGRQQTDAYTGLNQMLNRARGDYVILCHQDVRILEDGIESLDARLAELEDKDPAWALAGNAGGIATGQLALRISDPHGPDRQVGDLPARVVSLDENFIVVKRAARIGFSRDLAGYHFYGADICLVADILGYSAYVIDFHLEHLSAGYKGASFFEAEQAFRAKWSHALRSRWMQTTCSLVSLSGDAVGKLIGRVAEAPIEKLARRLPSALGWTKRPA